MTGVLLAVGNTVDCIQGKEVTVQRSAGSGNVLALRKAAILTNSRSASDAKAAAGSSSLCPSGVGKKKADKGSNPVRRSSPQLLIAKHPHNYWANAGLANRAAQHRRTKRSLHALSRPAYAHCNHATR